MKTINLSKVTFKPSLAGPEITQDVHKEVAEAIYQNATTLAQHVFAQKLFEADGDLEVSKEELGFVKDSLKGFKYFVQEGILKAIGEQGDGTEG